MKFIAEQTVLAEAAAWVAKGLPRRPAVPILSHIKIEVAAGQIRLQAFDYDMSLSVAVEADTGDSGTFLVPGHLLAAVLATAPHGPVSVDVDAAQAVLQAGKAVFTIPVGRVEDYPALPTMPDPDGELPDRKSVV